MSKAVNCVLMLQLLQNKRKWKIDDLSNELNMSPRMIRYYKEQLEIAGFDIETIRGKDGGYHLNGNTSPVSLTLTKEELDKLKNIITDEQIISKLTSNYHGIKQKYYSIINSFDHKRSEVEEELIRAIIDERKVKIVYKGSSERITIRNVIPIDIFVFEKEIYLIAYCELRLSIRNFKLNNIESYKIL